MAVGQRFIRLTKWIAGMKQRTRFAPSATPVVPLQETPGEWQRTTFALVAGHVLEWDRKPIGVEALHELEGRVFVVARELGPNLSDLCAMRDQAGEEDQLKHLPQLLRSGLGTGTVAALVDPGMAAKAKARSASKGYLDGDALAEVFAWLRPGDLIWNYWVNNYLLGNRPPALDLLFWNSDTTRMAAGLHADFVDMAVDNRLVQPGALTVLDVPIDLRAITVDAYVVAGITDHITPWESCYRTTQLLGGTTRFVLSTSGHVAAMVNPPGNPKASYRTTDEYVDTADAWLAGADTHQGTWWTDLAEWLNVRCGELKPAPERRGSATLPPLADAPGTYVLAK